MAKYHSIALRIIGVFLIVFGIIIFIGGWINGAFVSKSLITIVISPLLVIVVMISVGIALILLKKWGLYLLGLCLILFIVTLMRKGLPDLKAGLIAYMIPILFIYLFYKRKLLN